MTQLNDVATFAAKAKEFSKKMSTARDFNELLAMWRATSFPYALSESDPHSAAYREEVEKLYQTLANVDYSVNNELTSSKLSDDEFDIGFPWSTKNLSVIWPEMAKVIQAIRELEERDCQGKKVIEFGCGWGNLAIPLAKSGLDVAAVDIDEGFLRRVEARAKTEKVLIKTIQGDFVKAAKSSTTKYAVAMFQASFHHCLEFEELLQVIRDQVLDEGGFVLFGSEPIYADYPLPWGLRFDGESIWAITDKKWLELGFSEEFFFYLLLRNGYFARRVASIPTVLSEAWAADLGRDGVQFGAWRLPKSFDERFHPQNPGDNGRFSKGKSRLPGLLNSHHSAYQFDVQNFSKNELRVSVSAGGKSESLLLASGERAALKIDAKGPAVEIESDTFCPSDQGINNDERSLGVFIDRIKMI